ncbi:MAG: hypothetical protein QXP73_06315 [Candidatus Methanomethylicaceae archaeon]|nr:hypothetical protein [Candidatus Verstraetearchaeota archaeon]
MSFWRKENSCLFRFVSRILFGLSEEVAAVARPPGSPIFKKKAALPYARKAKYLQLIFRTP